MHKTLPISDLQRNFKAVQEMCAETGEPVYLTRNGKPALVIQDAQAYEEEKSLKDLIYEREMRTYHYLMLGHEQIENGEGVPFDEIRRDADDLDD